MMTRAVYSIALILFCSIVIDARKPANPLLGTNAVCADVCTSSEAHVELDLSEPRVYRENERVQVTLHPTGSGRCREPASLQIPLDTIGQHGIVKLDLAFGPVLHNFSIDIGIHDENNRTRRSINIFNQQVSIDYHADAVHIHEESVTLLEPGEHLAIFISNDWIQIENHQRNQQPLTVQFNQTKFFFGDGNDKSTSSYLRVGLNRDVDGLQTGIGLCSANLTFIECLADQEPALDVNVNNRTFAQGDEENIHWISHLNYLDPNADVRECSAQGVVRLSFDPFGSKRIARLDLAMGSQVQGFTFNIGDSSTNNGYGGDGGTTSNSAEIHSNDNRFYVWANTKICGDTLLLKIDYNVIEPFDNITILISNERIELTNHRSYHQILQSPYLYALARQNVTCNCFDSLCYPGVQVDNDVYVGINRVIGGTYRPGTGVCHASVNWIQCKKLEVSPRIKHEPISTTTIRAPVTPAETTTTTTTTTTAAAATGTSSTSVVQATTEEESTTGTPHTSSANPTHQTPMHTNSTVVNIPIPLSAMMMDDAHQTYQNEPSSTLESIPFATAASDETTEGGDEDAESQTTMSDTTISTPTTEATTQEEVHFTTVELASTEEVVLTTGQTRLFRLLANLSPSNSSAIEVTTTSEPTTSSTTVASNPCTLENLRANLVYHEYASSKEKFVFCDSEGKMNIIACSPNYVWSQNEQSCILPN